MRLSTILFSFIIGLYSMASFSGAGHNHGHSHAPPITQEKAMIEAKKTVSLFVSKKKLEESWLSVNASSAEKKVFNGSEEWVVTFKNEAVADVEKQQLYVFLSLSGGFIAANHTGE